MISTSIKAKREAKGWSKKYLGDLIGVSSAAIGQYEKGDNRPKVEVLLKLNKAFGYDFINDREITSLDGKDDELSHKSQNKPLSKSGVLSTQGVNFNDIGQLNTKLTFPENSTFPVDNKNMPNSDNRGDTPQWRQLYNIQQEEINLLNRKIELLNLLIQQ